MILSHLSLQALKAYAEYFLIMSKEEKDSTNVLKFYNECKSEIDKRNAKLSY